MSDINTLVAAIATKIGTLDKIKSGLEAALRRADSELRGMVEDGGSIDVIPRAKRGPNKAKAPAQATSSFMTSAATRGEAHNGSASPPAT